jgi:hypothetical protein
MLARYRSLLLPLLLLLAPGWGAARAQAPAPAPLLARLAAVADALERSLPSFTCVETVVSEELHGIKVARRVDFTANLRMTRGADGKLDEAFTVTTLNGNPFSSGVVPHPIYVDGGFGRAMMYFSTPRQPCYRYTVTGLANGGSRIDFVGLGGQPPCIDPGTVGFALLDQAGNVTHIERRVTDEVSRKHRLTPFAGIDFARVELSGRSYWLSQHMVAETPLGRNTAYFEATYSECHQFAATVTIGPASPEPQDDAAGATAPPK